MSRAKQTTIATVEETPDPASDILGSADIDAAAVKSMQLANRYIEVIDEADKRHLGDWYWVPEKMQREKWHFMRCGRRGAEYAESLAAQLCAMGWIDTRKVCPQVRPALFESDGEQGLYLCIRDDSYRNIKVAKAALQRRKEAAIMGAFGSAGQDINSLSGVSAEFNQTSTTRTIS